MLLKKRLLCGKIAHVKEVVIKIKNNNVENKNEKKKILVFVSKLAGGGAERAAINIAEELSKYYDVKILVYLKERKDYDTFLDVYEIRELRNKDWTCIFGLIDIMNLKKRENIYATISFLHRPNLYNIFSRKKDKIITTVRNNMEKANTKKQFFFHRHIVNKFSDKVVFVSEYTMEKQIKDYDLKKDKACFVHNFCEVPKIEKLANEPIPEEYKEIFSTGKIVITAGRLHHQKAQWSLIRSFSKVVKNKSDAKLVILGRGELKEYLQGLINNLNLQKNVFILDFDPNPYKYMKNSDLFVLSSLYEGMPNVVLEAMAIGLPIISADCKSGPREILAPDTDIFNEITSPEKAKYGILIPVLDETHYEYDDPLTTYENYLADEIYDMLRDDNKRKYYSEKSMERIKDFNKEKMIKKWIDIIEG